MQTLKFINISQGTSKKGNQYDMTEVSDGLSSFILMNEPGVNQKMREMDLMKGEEFQAEVHVSVKYGSLQGTIVDVEPA